MEIGTFISWLLLGAGIAAVVTVALGRFPAWYRRRLSPAANEFAKEAKRSVSWKDELAGKSSFMDASAIAWPRVITRLRPASSTEIRLLAVVIVVSAMTWLAGLILVLIDEPPMSLSYGVGISFVAVVAATAGLLLMHRYRTRYLIHSIKLIMALEDDTLLDPLGERLNSIKRQAMSLGVNVDTDTDPAELMRRIVYRYEQLNRETASNDARAEELLDALGDLGSRLSLLRGEYHAGQESIENFVDEVLATRDGLLASKDYALAQRMNTLLRAAATS